MGAVRARLRRTWYSAAALEKIVMRVFFVPSERLARVVREMRQSSAILKAVAAEAQEEGDGSGGGETAPLDLTAVRGARTAADEGLTERNTRFVCAHMRSVSKREGVVQSTYQHAYVLRTLARLTHRSHVLMMTDEPHRVADVRALLAPENVSLTLLPEQARFEPFGADPAKSTHVDTDIPAPEFIQHVKN